MLWQTPKPGACLSFSFMRLIFSWAVLHSGSSNPQLIMLKYLYQHSLSFFYAMHMAVSDYVQNAKRTKFSRLISLWQKVSGISLKYPPFFLFFEKDTSSDLWEVATCLSKLLWMMDDSIPIFPFAHRCWNCASLRLDAVGNGASKYISSRSLLIHPSWDWTDTFFSPPSRFDSMISSHIFGSLKGLGP